MWYIACFVWTPGCSKTKSILTCYCQCLDVVRLSLVLKHHAYEAHQRPRYENFEYENILHLQYTGWWQHSEFCLQDGYGGEGGEDKSTRNQLHLALKGKLMRCSLRMFSRQFKVHLYVVEQDTHHYTTETNRYRGCCWSTGWIWSRRIKYQSNVQMMPIAIVQILIEVTIKCPRQETSSVLFIVDNQINLHTCQTCPCLLGFSFQWNLEICLWIWTFLHSEESLSLTEVWPPSFEVVQTEHGVNREVLV